MVTHMRHSHFPMPGASPTPFTRRTPVVAPPVRTPVQPPRPARSFADVAQAVKPSLDALIMTPKKKAVFMDAGAVFFAFRDLYEGGQLDYAALAERIKSEILQPWPTDTHDVMWVMWSSVVPQNDRQVRFLDYAERQLGWTVRRFSPSDGYMVDPLAAPGLTVDERGKARLLRFDASIAFAIGRVAEDHQIALITDSFAMAEPLSRAARMANCQNAIIFFGRLLDPRWQARLRSEDHLKFYDLDAWGEEIIGDRRPKDTSAWNDDFLIR